MNALMLENICKTFGDVRAVDNLNIQVPTGSIYGFLGPNGAGKTTTLRMIMNIIRPDSGSITLLGNKSLEKLKSRLGYMPEERGLYRKMKVNKMLAYFAALKAVPAAEISARVSRWLQRVELGGWADKKVEDLSRGMHQKLQFAVTVVNEPDLLILDEPFSGLDPLNLDLIKSIILEMRNQGKTIILSTHMMHEAESLCDFILLINQGKSVVDGKLSDIRSRKNAPAVLVQLEGETDFIAALPQVAAVKAQANQWEIALADGADPQALFKELVGKVRVLKFELKAPSLHEIFVNYVGASHAKNS